MRVYIHTHTLCGKVIAYKLLDFLPDVVLLKLFCFDFFHQEKTTRLYDFFLFIYILVA